MMDQSSDALSALVDVASCLRPIPEDNSARTFSSALKAHARETAAAVVSEDERSQESFSPSRNVVGKASPSSPIPSSTKATFLGTLPVGTIPATTTTMNTTTMMNMMTSASPTMTAASSSPPAYYEDFVEEPTSSSKRPKSRPLPLVLMELLTDPSHSDVLSFLPGGDAFAILRPHSLENGEALRKHFRCVRVTTFVKKLENWGFVRHTTTSVNNGASGGGRPVLVFSHPLFRRGDWDSVGRIRCQKKRPTPGSALARYLNDAASASSASAAPSLPSSTEIETHLHRSSAMRNKVVSVGAGMTDESMTLRRMLSTSSQAAAAAAARSLSPTMLQEAHESSVESAAEVAQARLRLMMLRQRRAAAAQARLRHQEEQELIELRQLDRVKRRQRQQAQFVSQAEVDLATQSIVGAAMDVLARDPNAAAAGGRCRRPQSPPSATAMARGVAARSSPPPLSSSSSSPPLALPRVRQARAAAAFAADSFGSAFDSDAANMVSAERIELLRRKAELALAARSRRHRQAALLRASSGVASAGRAGDWE